MLFSKKYINFIIVIIILELYKNDIKFCVVFWKNYASRKKIQLWDRVNIGCDIWTLIVLKRTMLCPAGTYAWKKSPSHICGKLEWNASIFPAEDVVWQPEKKATAVKGAAV